MGYFNQAIDVADNVISEYQMKNRKSIEYWGNSPLHEITKLPPRSKGKFGEEVVANLLMEYGYDILKPDNSKSDFKVSDGVTEANAEVKLSFLWSGAVKQNYMFQQVRLKENYNYDLLLCLGISRDNIKLYPFTKKSLKIGGNDYSVESMSRNGILKAQHSASSCWFSVSDEKPNNWHSNGDVDEALYFIDDYFVTLG